MSQSSVVAPVFESDGVNTPRLSGGFWCCYRRQSAGQKEPGGAG